MNCSDDTICHRITTTISPRSDRARLFGEQEFHHDTRPFSNVSWGQQSDALLFVLLRQKSEALLGTALFGLIAHPIPCGSKENYSPTAPLQI